MADLRGARGLDGKEVRRDITHRAFGVFLRLLPATAAEGVERRTRLARANVFADEMRLADGNVETRRRLIGIAGGVLDGETFLLRAGGARGFLQRFQAAGDGHELQTAIASDAVLEMHDVIAVVEIGEVDVEQRARGLRVRRLEPARALDFVASEYFSIGDDDELRLFVEEAAGERTEVGEKVRGEGQGARR